MTKTLSPAIVPLVPATAGSSSSARNVSNVIPSSTVMMPLSLISRWLCRSSNICSAPAARMSASVSASVVATVSTAKLKASSAGGRGVSGCVISRITSAGSGSVSAASISGPPSRRIGISSAPSRTIADGTPGASLSAACSKLIPTGTPSKSTSPFSMDTPAGKPPPPPNKAS